MDKEKNHKDYRNGQIFEIKNPSKMVEAEGKKLLVLPVSVQKQY